MENEEQEKCSEKECIKKQEEIRDCSYSKKRKSIKEESCWYNSVFIPYLKKKSNLEEETRMRLL